jgi:hypothetical protein
VCIHIYIFIYIYVFIYHLFIYLLIYLFIYYIYIHIYSLIIRKRNMFILCLYIYNSLYTHMLGAASACLSVV